jgi:hypothetical protein
MIHPTMTSADDAPAGLGLRPHSPATISQIMTRSVLSIKPDMNRRMPSDRVCVEHRAASSPRSWRRPVLDRDPAADTAVGSIECSGTCISRQSSDRAEGHAVSGADRMQRAVWIDLPAAAPDDNLPVDN